LTYFGIFHFCEQRRLLVTLRSVLQNATVPLDCRASIPKEDSLAHCAWQYPDLKQVKLGTVFIKLKIEIRCVCVHKVLSIEKFIYKFLKMILDIKAEISVQNFHPAQGPNVVVKYVYHRKVE
jgi:hypothetical protein